MDVQASAAEVVAVVAAAKVTVSRTAPFVLLLPRASYLLSSAAGMRLCDDAAAAAAAADAADAADCMPLTCPFRWLQERSRGLTSVQGSEMNVIYAAQAGNAALVRDFLLVDPACVNQSDG